MDQSWCNGSPVAVADAMFQTKKKAEDFQSDTQERTSLKQFVER